MGVKTATEAEECGNLAMARDEAMHQTNTVDTSRLRSNFHVITTGGISGLN